MKIGLNVFSCSRFRELTASLSNYAEFLPDYLWGTSLLHEDVFQRGIEEIELTKKFQTLLKTSPRLGLGHAFYRVYSRKEVKEFDYIVHLEDDWAFSREVPYKEVCKVMEKEDLCQVYLCSKMDLEQAKKRAKREPEYIFDNGRLGLYILKNRYETFGHILPNTTPHIGAKGLFEDFIVKMEEFSRLASERGKENPWIAGATPRRAWKIWQKTVPKLKKNAFRYAVLLSQERPLIRHEAVRWHRLSQENTQSLKGYKK